jgi:hypothetical protein
MFRSEKAEWVVKAVRAQSAALAEKLGEAPDNWLCLRR